jgi:hypothetical protein
MNARFPIIVETGNRRAAAGNQVERPDELAPEGGGWRSPSETPFPLLAAREPALLPLASARGSERRSRGAARSLSLGGNGGMRARLGLVRLARGSGE